MTEKNVVGVEKKESQMPVFNADIMETEEDRIQPAGGISGVSRVAPISANVSTTDAIGMWRIFSERLRSRRFAKQAGQNNLFSQNAVNPSISSEPDFQDNYENDDILISGGNKNAKFLDHLLEKIWFANLNVDPDKLHKIEDEEYQHPDDRII